VGIGSILGLCEANLLGLKSERSHTAVPSSQLREVRSRTGRRVQTAQKLGFDEMSATECCRSTESGSGRREMRPGGLYGQASGRSPRIVLWHSLWTTGKSCAHQQFLVFSCRRDGAFNSLRITQTCGLSRMRSQVPADQCHAVASQPMIGGGGS
jgi:hypothetical protein